MSLSLAVAACGDTTNITQDTKGDGKACVNAVCPDNSKDTEKPEPAEDSSPSPSESRNPSPGDSGVSGDTSDSETDGSTDSGVSGGATRSVEGERFPTTVRLSSGNIPPGLRNSPDDCTKGCVDWDAEDLIVGNEDFDSGFLAWCKSDCKGDRTRYFAVKLSGKYSRFDAVFGISGESPGEDKTETLRVAVADHVTGKNLYSDTLEYGKSYPERIDISGVNLLRITFEGPLRHMNGAVGDPTIYS
ncbi:hypothetical protein [Streptomyces xinghaiensis]|uniref:hypothetical protein n=1 Tax=Streptomyces xinghaiensis TaxID=1038928 RepID=UPI002E12451B|nr:hypothetical protein OG463_15090 [Streptomyces xinghaiensis]